MAKVSWGIRVSAAGEKLPWMHVQCGETVMKFPGRPGLLLMPAVEAVEKLERERLERQAVEVAAAEAMLLLAPEPSDVRD